MKSCVHLKAKNEEVMDQNAYLRWQLGWVIEAKEKVGPQLILLLNLPKKKKKINTISMDHLVRKNPLRIPKGEEDINPTLMILGLRSRSLKGG